MADLRRQHLLSLIRGRVRRGHVVLTSGKHSDFHVDLRPLCLDVEAGQVLGEQFGQLLAREFDDGKLCGIGGLAVGAVPLAVRVSATVGYEAFFVRSETQKHGRGRRLEASRSLKPGAQVVVIDDVATTGASLLEAAAVAREQGFEVVGVAVVVDREEGARERVESQLGVPFRALFTAAEVLAT